MRNVSFGSQWRGIGGITDNVPQLSDGRISPVTKALDKYTILFRFFKLCSYAPVAKLVL